MEVSGYTGEEHADAVLVDKADAEGEGHAEEDLEELT